MKKEEHFRKVTFSFSWGRGDIKNYFVAKLKFKKINTETGPILDLFQENLIEKAKGHVKLNYSDNIFKL